MSFLLDTNVLSELRKKSRRDERVTQWIESTNAATLNVSVLAIGEVRHGIELLRRRRDSRQAIGLELWLEAIVRAFGERVLPVTTEAAERWGRLNAARPLPVVDGLMVATALEQDLTFVTRDVKPLESTGVRLLNPWGTR